ncbi:hypothetical protein LS482_16685 [Sinomicrobium kalidii]|uniref:hypothetical protein n=1 Tax=Sinomicrobium kalidii TaxID=2900738 RepID=UPI001E6425C9|nr:hypothetical protein [Sinomicrobium kalidii]UGU15309.1 hypothetical protein LS482_16685 [Sinomicrobium kalidii]
MKETLQTTVEIFKTDVTDPTVADSCILTLSRRFPRLRINFDLEDRDRILRVEGHTINIREIVKILNALCVDCTLYVE